MSKSRINTFYEHIDGKGTSFTLPTGANSLNVGEFWNDKISSVRIAPWSKASLYEHAEYGGQSVHKENKTDKSILWNLTTENDWLGWLRVKFNDQTSSIRIDDLLS